MFRKFTPSNLYFIHKVGTKNIWGEWEEWSQEKFGLEKTDKHLTGEVEARAKEWPKRTGRGFWNSEREETANLHLQQKRTE